MRDRALIREVCSQILEAAERIERRFSAIQSPEQFLSNDEGIDRLDAICMMLIAIGESLKNLDKITHRELSRRHPEIDWDGAKGVRDILSHHYFQLDAEVVYDVCRNKMPGLIRAIKTFMNELKDDCA